MKTNICKIPLQKVYHRILLCPEHTGIPLREENYWVTGGCISFERPLRRTRVQTVLWAAGLFRCVKPGA